MVDLPVNLFCDCRKIFIFYLERYLMDSLVTLSLFIGMMILLFSFSLYLIHKRSYLGSITISNFVFGIIDIVFGLLK